MTEPNPFADSPEYGTVRYHMNIAARHALLAQWAATIGDDEARGYHCNHMEWSWEAAQELRWNVQ